MNIRDHVALTDAGGTHFGVITTRRDDGLCSVKWDSGITERIHEDELVLVQPERSFTTRLLALWHTRR